MTHKTRTAGGVVLNAHGHVLVVNQNHNSWSLPKGHIEVDENPLQAAIREIAEESGITDLKLICELGTYERYKIGSDGHDDPSELKVMTFYLFQTQQMTLNPTDIQNPEARWVEKDKVTGLLTHPKDQEFMRRVIGEYLSE